MDGFHDITAAIQSDQNDPLINKLGRETELLVGGTLFGFAKGISTTTERPESLLGVAGGAIVGTGLSALQLRYPGFRPAGAMLAAGLGYFAIKDVWNRAPAVADAVSDTWESSTNQNRNIRTFADNVGTPLWDAQLFWGAGRLMSAATTGFLYRPGGPLVKIPEQWHDGALIPHKRTDPIAQAFENTKQGIVQVQIPNATISPKTGDPMSAFGSGFLVAADGKIATNAHVAIHAMRPGQEARIFNQGESMTAKVLKVDVANDLAILQVNELNKLAKMKPLKLGDGDPARSQTVFLSGHPNGEPGLSIVPAQYGGNNTAVMEVRKNLDANLQFRDNIHERIRMPWKSDNLVATKEGFEAHEVTRGMLSFAARNGMSGSPVFNEAGTVFGVFHSSSPITFQSFHGRVGALKQLLSEV
jgi:Trypsin-like serine proteases, typically periplasmic, contain C-terminal PDZ domain